MTLQESTQLLRVLEENGYLSHQAATWQFTILAGALCRATTRKPFSRAVAQRHLDEFLQRVNEANSSPDWVWWVEEVLLFGSMLDREIDKVSDVDVAVRLTPRYHEDEQQERVEAFISAALAAGRSFPNYTLRAYWSKTALLRFLLGRSTSIQLTDERDQVLKMVTPVVLYKRQEAT